LAWTLAGEANQPYMVKRLDLTTAGLFHERVTDLFYGLEVSLGLI